MEKYFQQALSNFTFDAACGGAIRHLAKLGYTAKEVYERLTFPTPYERVRREYTKCLLEEGILLREKPEPDTEYESLKVNFQTTDWCSIASAACDMQGYKYEYVQEEGRFGRKSFRRVKVRSAVSESPSYVACTFALEGQKDGFQSLPLTPKQREYLEGICWERMVMYHVLDERMQDIVRSLSEGADHE